MPLVHVDAIDPLIKSAHWAFNWQMFWCVNSQADTEFFEQSAQVKGHPDSWFAVDTILATSSSPDTKFFALNVLENVICTRWMVLPESQRAGIKMLGFKEKAS